MPLEQGNKVEVRLPRQCGHCGASLPQKVPNAQTQGEPRRHPVTEVPQPQAPIPEYPGPNGVCRRCGKTPRASLPAEVAGDLGPRLLGWIAYRTAVCRLPRRLVEALLADRLGIEISLGSTQPAVEAVREAVPAPCQEWQEQGPHEKVLNGDETGWRTNGDKRRIWALGASPFIFYVVAAQRSAAVRVAWLGIVFQGILCSDRFQSYLSYHQGKRQLCWAHLKRNRLGLLDYPKSLEAEPFARDALAQYARRFRLGGAFGRGSSTAPN